MDKIKIFGKIKNIIKDKKGLTWGFIAKILIWLVALGILIYVIALAGQKAGGIIQKIKDIF